MEILGSRGGEKLESQNLRDLLRIKEEDQSTSSNTGGARDNPSANLTLNAVLSLKRGPPPAAEEPLQRVQSNRTLLDIIREDQTSGLGGGRRDARRSWQHLKNKIRLRRRESGTNWSSAVAIPTSDVPLNNQNRVMMMTRLPSLRFNSSESTQPDANSNRTTETASGRIDQSNSLPRRRLISEITESNHNGDEEHDRTVEEGVGVVEQPVRMSLMALLAETDRQMGVEGSAYLMDEEEDEEEEVIVAVAGAGVNGGEYNNCCVCMVRHKGAAFIPCGHTFCRLCSRELWVQRGNCPLCNHYILEILDIF